MADHGKCQIRMMNRADRQGYEQWKRTIFRDNYCQDICLALYERLVRF